MKHYFHHYKDNNPYTHVLFEHCIRCPCHSFENNPHECSNFACAVGKTFLLDEEEVIPFLLINLNHHISGKYPDILIMT